MSSDYEDDWDEAAEAELLAIESSLSISTPIARPPPVHLEITVDDNSLNAIASTSKLHEITQGDISIASSAFINDEVIEAVPDNRSLWERFRKRRGGNFSVSDLVGPSWCEVQHTYRLSSKAYLRPEARPTSITTQSGVIVPIDLSRTISREIILDEGKAIHKVIEDEVMGVMEEVKVEIETEEDRWSLRILNMCVGLETLLATGRTRELSVHGFVGDDLLVYGIIDEIYRQDMTPATSSSTTSSSSTTKKPIEEDTTQKKLETFFTTIPSPKKSTEKGKERVVEEPSKEFKRWAYIISDTKTRNSPTVPRRGDSKSARLQLMLYHQLLTSLLVSPPNSSTILPMTQSLPQPFSWTTLYSKLSLDPTLPLSSTYLTSILPVVTGSSLELTIGTALTLGEYVTILQSYGKRLSSTEKGPFENRLEISYRLRNNVSRFNWKERSKLKKLPEDEELAKAIAESLRNVDSRSSGVVGDGGNDEDEEQLALAIALSLSEFEVAVEGLDQQVELKDDPPLSLVVSEEETDALSLLADSTLLLDTTSQIDDTYVFSPLPTTFDLDIEENSQVQSTSKPILAFNKRRQSSPPEIQTEIIERTPKRSKIHDVDPSKPDRTLQLTPPFNSTKPASNPVLPAVPATSNIETLSEGSLIGVEKFAFNSQLLKAHLDDMIQYWMGIRKARGVELEQTYRCRTCEFESGCEWREAKANSKQFKIMDE